MLIRRCTPRKIEIEYFKKKDALLIEEVSLWLDSLSTNFSKEHVETEKAENLKEDN